MMQQYFYKFKKFISTMFKTPLADELAIIELEEAKRQLLHMQTALDYSKRMVDYHSDRIKRLNAYVAKASTEEAGV